MQFRVSFGNALPNWRRPGRLRSNQMQFFTAESESDTARAMLEMVRRGCVRLMRQGGGALPKETPTGTVLRLSPEQRSRLVSLMRSGFTPTQAAEVVGCSQATASKVRKAAGLGAAPRVGRRVEVVA